MTPASAARAGQDPTAPLLALPLALAVGVLTSGRTSPVETLASPAGTMTEPVTAEAHGWRTIAVGAAVVVVAVAGAPVAAYAVGKPRVVPRTCPDGTPAQALLGGTSVRIVADRRAPGYGLDALDPASATRGLSVLPGLLEVVPYVLPSTTIVAGLTPDGDDRVAFVSGGTDIGGSVLYLCGSQLNDPLSSVLTNAFWPKPVTFAFLTGTALPESTGAP